jgi:hypothetical protein
MPTSFSKPGGRHSQSRLATTFLLIYGAVCVGLLGYFIVFPDEATLKSQAENRLGPDVVHSAQKQGRYEGVISNWARYRASNLTAEAR